MHVHCVYPEEFINMMSGLTPETNLASGSRFIKLVFIQLCIKLSKARFRKPCVKLIFRYSGFNLVKRKFSWSGKMAIIFNFDCWQCKTLFRRRLSAEGAKPESNNRWKSELGHVTGG